MIKRLTEFIKKIDGFLVVPVLLFLSFMLPFFGSIPYLDGSIDFVKSVDFHRGGMEQYLKNWSSVHPPLKVILASGFFAVGGVRTGPFNLMGILFGIAGILGIYFLGYRLVNKRVARWSSLFLASQPLFLSVGIFGLLDYLFAVMVILVIYFSLAERYFLLGISLLLAVMVKETGMLLPLAFLMVEGFFVLKKKKIVKAQKFIYYFLPFVLFWFWVWYLRMNEKTVWADWNFSPVANRGSFYTVIYNLASFGFFNKYAYQNWWQLIFLNFHWLFLLIAVTGLVTFLKEKGRLVKESLNLESKKIRVLMVIAIFVTGYLLAVLSFQTYTIPRYALPLIPFLILGASFGLEVFWARNLKRGFFLFLGLAIVIVMGLFSSVDPLATRLWGKTKVLGEEIYALPEHLAGNDGITYNMQYLFMVKKRTEKILSGSRLSKEECYWLFPDPKNDYKTMRILKLENLSAVRDCQGE